MSSDSSLSRVGLRLALWVWFLAALLAGALGFVARLPDFGVPVLIAVLTALTLLVAQRVPAARALLDATDVRTLVALHLVRFVGVYLLFLHARGMLPYAFAVPAGIGDIVVAAAALLLLVMPLAPARRDRALAIWNTLGLVDLVLVVVTAARLSHAQPASMRALTLLPLSLLPTFLVPLLLATHVILYRRLKT
ncbi:hypothetical protein K0B96_05280 [Horticoccus luteus]|uniref:Uncharacterized protein n=1 Tax=Horticoccus luteus TaxID=2862869 RepID=A0A8F9XKU1_9BACT|nr:hypothetical protein [Horticoccus luteus]QYM80033.1 hypothetical protein K0B96_05280 [Horticoccus luteus]